MKSFKFASILLISILAFCFTSHAIESKKDNITLTEKLKEMADQSKLKGTSEKRKIMEDAIEQVRRDHITEKAIKVGDTLPSFTLPDVKSQKISSVDLLKKGPLVVVFYRGGWCPYCNLQLHDLQKYLPEIKKLGANLVAISPQTPDESLSTAQKDNLSFYVLSDVGSKVGKQFGLIYKLPENLKKLYKEFGIDLEKSNATKDWELPLASTYVVKPDGKVIYSFLNADYKKRADTEDILKVLKALKSKK